MKRKAAYNTGFASGGVTCKPGAMCFYSSSVLVDSFVLRNPPERKARKRYYSIAARLLSIWQNKKRSVVLSGLWRGRRNGMSVLPLRFQGENE